MRLLVLIACLSCLPARADEARLTDRGRWLVSGALRGSWSNNDGYSGRDLPLRWELRATPSMLYFVRDRLGLGGYAGYEYTRDPGFDYELESHGLSIGVLGALELELAPRVGWLLLPSLGYAWRESSAVANPHGVYLSSTAAGARSQVRTSLLNLQFTGTHHMTQLGVFAPLVLHVTEALAFGVGPELAVDVWWNTRDPADGSRFVQVRVGVGSWVGASF